MNILKSVSSNPKDTYTRAYRLFGFENRLKQIKSGIKSYRFYHIEQTETHISFTPVQTLEYLSTIDSLKAILDTNSLRLILENTKAKTFRLAQHKEIMSYLHLDWLLVLNEIANRSDNIDELAEHLALETNNHSLVDVLTGRTGHTELRSNIYTTNLNSTIISKVNPLQNQHAADLSDRNLSLIKTNKLLAFIEIDRGYDNSKLEQFLTEAKRWCNLIYKKETVTSEQCFNLKIRKIKRTRKRGMFIANQNTIIIDPRHTDSFIHELGHWYHTHFRADIKTEAEAEQFAETFGDYLKYRI